MNKTCPQQFWSLVASFLIAAFCHSANNANAQQEILSALPTREIRVPYADLPVLLSGTNERIFMTRAEYGDLLKQAGLTPAKVAQAMRDKQERDSLPLKWILTAANYEIRIDSGRAVIEGDLVIELLQDQLTPLPLVIKQAGLVSVSEDGKPVKLASTVTPQLHEATKAIASGTVLTASDTIPDAILFLEGKGVHRLKLRMLAATIPSAAQQSIQFTLPKAAANSWQMTVPGNVEIVSGAFVRSRSVDSASETTRFDLLPSSPQAIANGTSLDITMTLNNKVVRDSRSIECRCVVLDEIHESYEQVFLNMAVHVLNGAENRIQLKVPAGFEIRSVSSPLLSKWNIVENKGNDGAKQILDLELREAVTDRFAVDVTAIRSTLSDSSEKDREWSFPKWNILNADTQTSIVAVLLPDQLDLLQLNFGSLIPLDHAVINDVLAIKNSFEPSLGRIRTAFALYSPSAKYEVSGSVVKQKQPDHRSLNLHATVRESGIQLDGIASITASGESVSALDLQLAEGWRVVTANKPDGTKLRFEALRTKDSPTSNAAQAIRIRIEPSIKPNTSEQVIFQLEIVPANWLTDWREQLLTFPRVALADSSDAGSNGQSAKLLSTILSISKQGDFQFEGVDPKGLIPLFVSERALLQVRGDESGPAYSVDSTDWALSMVVRRTEPIIASEIFSYFKIAREGVRVAYEMHFDVSEAATDKLEFSLPETTPRELTIRGLNGVSVKETSSRVVNGRREWILKLANRATGTLKVSAECMLSLTLDQSHTLPALRTKGTMLQTGVIALEGDDELDVTIEKHPRQADVGELTESNYPIGNQLIGVYRYHIGGVENTTNSEDAIIANWSNRDLGSIPSTIIQMLKLDSAVAVGGASVHVADAKLKTVGSFIAIDLPKDATLWSITMNGIPALPQREAGQLLIELKPDAASDGHVSLQVVYELQVSGIGLRSRVDLIAPVFKTIERDLVPAEKIPIVTTSWRLWHSRDLIIVGTAGEFQTSVPVGSRAFPYTLGWHNNNSLNDIITGGTNETYSIDKSSMIAPPRAQIASPPGGMGGMGSGAPQVAADLDIQVRNNFSVTPSIKPPTPATGFPGQPNGPAIVSQNLEGWKTLPIPFQNAGTWLMTEVGGLSNDASIQLSIVDDKRLAWIGYFLAAVLVMLGLLAPKTGFSSSLLFGGCLLAVLVMAPLFSPWPYETGVLAGYAFFAVLLVIVLRTAILLSGVSVSTMLRMQKSVAPVKVSLAIVIGLCLSASATAQDIPPKAIGSVEDFIKLLHSHENHASGPIVIPANAILVPFEPKSQPPKLETERILVPLTVFKQLKELADPSKSRPTKTELPTEFSLANLRYQASLDRDDSLILRMEVDVHLHSDQAVMIPFGLADAVMTSATLDDVPATVQAMPNAIALVANQEGMHRFAATFQVPVIRQGGWRIARAVLPSSASGSMTIQVPNKETELQLIRPSFTESHETTSENQSIETLFPSTGGLSIQWRPKVTDIRADQGLVANAVNIVNVLEQGLKLSWDVKLSFRTGQRDRFEFELPSDVLVEKVSGKNIRGWKVEVAEGKQIIQVILLKGAIESEQLTIAASRPVSDELYSEKGIELKLPGLVVPEAMLQQGSISIVRSGLLELQTSESVGLVRQDLPLDGQVAPILGNPIQTKPYQSYRYSTADYRLNIAVKPSLLTLNCKLQTTVQVSRNESQLDCKITIDPKMRAAHRVQFLVPDSWNWERLASAAPTEWTLSESVNGMRTFDVLFQTGQTQPTDLMLKATQRRKEDSTSSEFTVPLPRIVVSGAAMHEGEIRIVADRGVSVIPENLVGCERFGDIVRFRSDEYSGTVRLRNRASKISAMSISNSKMTRRSLEESIYMEWTIQEAGARTIEFVLPERFKDAPVLAQMIRSIKRVPIVASGTETEAMLRFTLELQDEVMGQYRVLIQKDSPLPDGDSSVPIPSNLTGTLEGRYVTLENSGDSELVIDTLKGVSAMVRGESQWVKLASLLGGQSADAYRVEESQLAAAESPVFRFKTKSRSIVETASARIALAQTVLSLEATGNYRATILFRVENTSEPYLEVELPQGAELWTVTVADKPVKPIVSSNPAKRTGGSRVRLPLVRTQKGDLDYGVELKYAGKLQVPTYGSKWNLPLIESVNINSELSQVKLMLPASHYWYGFDGTLGQVKDESDFLAGWLLQKNKQITRLSELAANDGEEFAKARAIGNLKQLEADVQVQLQNSSVNSPSNVYLQEQINMNDQVFNDAKLKQSQNQTVQSAKPDNRDSFNSLFSSQSNYRAQGRVDNGRSDGVQTVSPSKVSSAVQAQQPPQAARRSKDSRSLAESYSGKIANGMQSFSNSSANMGFGGGMSIGQNALQPSSQNLASLNVAFELPGRSYYFVTPRGDVELEVSSLSKSFVSRLIYFALTLMVIAFACFIRRFRK